MLPSVGSVKAMREMGVEFLETPDAYYDTLHELVGEVRHPIEVRASEDHLLPWLSRRGSSFIWGVWHDAKYLADQIAVQRGYLAYNGSEVSDRVAK